MKRISLLVSMLVLLVRSAGAQTDPSEWHLSISVVSGLPRGLTEMAIAAARQVKFIPAMKDGKYVSISTQLVYRFDLY